jgi:hypothetical protein
MPKIKIVCSHCGSDDVRRDADAVWSNEAQEWELCAVYDQGTCEQCGGEASLDEVELTPAEIAGLQPSEADKVREALELAKAYLDAYFEDASTGIADGTYDDVEWFKALTADMAKIEAAIGGKP